MGSGRATELTAQASDAGGSAGSRSHGHPLPPCLSLVAARLFLTHPLANPLLRPKTQSQREKARLVQHPSCLACWGDRAPRVSSEPNSPRRFLSTTGSTSECATGTHRAGGDQLTKGFLKFPENVCYKNTMRAFPNCSHPNTGVFEFRFSQHL